MVWLYFECNVWLRKWLVFMKVIQNLLFIVRSLFLLAFSSSSKNVEEIWINKDGTGKYKSTQDLSTLLPFIKMAMLSSIEEEEDALINNASVKNAWLKKLKEIFTNNSADVSFVIEDMLIEMFAKKNAIFTFDSFQQKFFERASKNSIEFTTIEKESLSSFFESISKSSLNIKMDVNEAYLIMTTKQAFTRLGNIMFSGLNETVNVFSKVDNITNLRDKLQIQQVKKMMGSIPQYVMKDDSIYVMRDPIDLDLMDGKAKQNFQIMKGIIGQHTYKTIIHAPNTILSTNQATATYEGSTVTWEVPNEDLYDTSKDLDIEINF